MKYDEMTDLLTPGYLELETGYRMLPESEELLVAVYNRMMGCKHEWLDRWFGHFETEADFIEWHPEEHFTHVWNDKWSKGNYIGAAHTAKQKIGGRQPQFSTIHFEDPSIMFDMDKVRAANATVVLAYGTPGEFGDSEYKMTRFVHIARNTRFGCEIRSRFWVKTTEEFGPLLIDHCFGEFGFAQDIWKREFS